VVETDLDPEPHGLDLEMMARPLRPAARLVLRAIAQRSALCFSFAAMELSRRS
jgi:hypothetical protein